MDSKRINVSNITVVLMLILLKITDALESNFGIKQVVGLSAVAAAIYLVLSNLSKDDIPLNFFILAKPTFF